MENRKMFTRHPASRIYQYKAGGNELQAGKMENGKCEMENGRRKMKEGKWEIVIIDWVKISFCGEEYLRIKPKLPNGGFDL
jgi:hypothetical protein